MGDFSVDKTLEDCAKRVDKHLDSLGFSAAGEDAASTKVFRESSDRRREDPSFTKTMLGVASNILLSSSSRRGEPEPSRSVQVVVLEEGAGTRLVVDASEPGLQQSLDEWVRTELGGQPQN